MTSSLATLVTVLVIASLGQAHYVFVRLAHNGVWQDPMRYIRNRTANYYEDQTPDLRKGYRGWPYPTYATDRTESIRCGRDNLAWSSATEVLKVKAGDTFEFVATQFSPDNWDRQELITWNNCPDGRGACSPKYPETDFNFEIFHVGPAIMQLSQVPAGQDIHTYDGSGEWVKIKTWGLEIRKELENPRVWVPQNGGGWPPRFVAQLPKQTPAGKYLLRMDQIYYGSGQAFPQMYPSCAHIEVESDVTGSLPKGIKIPEDMSKDSPGMTDKDLYGAGWPYPGGQLWDGEKLVEDISPPWDVK